MPSAPPGAPSATGDPEPTPSPSRGAPSATRGPHPAASPPRGPSTTHTRGFLRFHLSTPWGLAGLLTVLALEAWGIAAADPDYYLPDAFRPLAVGVIALYLLVGLAPWPRVRGAVRGTLIVATVAILLLEGIASLPREPDDRIQISDDRLLRYHYRPGASVGDDEGGQLDINQHGLWDQDYAIPKPKGVYRVAVIGGSMGNDGGIAYPKRYHNVLERLLNEAPINGKRVEVLNLSVEGYSTLQEVHLLERVGLLYEPDFVLVGYQLTDPFMQNGAANKVGNSRYLFRFILPIRTVLSSSRCSLVLPLYDSYGFDLMVSAPLERLKLLERVHGFRSLVAILPAVADPKDPVCNGIYDRVADTARRAGLAHFRLTDALQDLSMRDLQKTDVVRELTHVSVLGHRRVGEALAQRIRAMAE